MENPYWHPEEKSHVVNPDEVRLLSFEVFNIIQTSMSLMRQGEPVDEDGNDERSALETVHYELAESELAAKLLRIAVLMRTLDDYWSDWGHEDYVKKVLDLNESGGIGTLETAKKINELSLREAFNKIIHATDIRPVYEKTDETDKVLARWGMDGELELGGANRNAKWEASLSLLPFLDAVVDLVNFVDGLQS